MKLNQADTCPKCGGQTLNRHRTYETLNNGTRELHQCEHCQDVFSKTRGIPIIPMHNLKTPISKVASVLRVRSEGLGAKKGYNALWAFITSFTILCVATGQRVSYLRLLWASLREHCVWSIYL